MNWDTIFLGAALGFVIAIIVGEFIRTPSYKKTLPQEIAELAAKDERERIVGLLTNDEVLHNIWWRIKREDTFPTQDFISDVIYEELELGGTND